MTACQDDAYVHDESALPLSRSLCRSLMLVAGYVWVILGFLVVAATKYLCSLRLRNLADKMQRDQQDTSELRYQLVQAEEREHQLKSETERLQAKLTALRNVVGNLERSLQRFVAPASSGGDSA